MSMYNPEGGIATDDSTIIRASPQTMQPTPISSLPIPIPRPSNKYSSASGRGPMIASGSRPANNEMPKDEYESDSDSADEGSRFKVVIQKFDPRSKTFRDKNFNPKKHHERRIINKSQSQKGQQAFVLRKFEGISISRSLSAELTITNPHLGTLLQSVIKSYTLHPLRQGMLNVISPFCALVHNWDALEAETSKEGSTEEDQTARSDLHLLLLQLREWSGDDSLDSYMKMRSDLVSADSITFEALWTIFPPGTLVYSKKFLGQDQLFVVMESQPKSTKLPNDAYDRTETPPWKMICLTYDWNGKRFDRYLMTFTIHHFDETKPIAALPVYPWKYVPNKKEMKEKLLTRGNKFRKFCVASSGSHMFKYQGQALVDKRGFGFVTEQDDDGRFLNRSPFSRGSIYPGMQPQLQGTLLRDMGQNGSTELVMVDFASHYKYAEAGQRLGDTALNINRSECRSLRTRYDSATGAPEENWEEEQLMLCSPRVLGYILQEKMWAQFLVDGIEEIDEGGSQTAFNDRLVLPEDSGLNRKTILMGLVKSHYAAYSDDLYQLEDIVPGKGKGLIILLYGPPGVGKTSTEAETLAIATRKPLFSVGVADVGTSAKYVEPNLERIFDLAQKWKAILLIDEADVFLQSRGSGQVGATTERNALVSVFLRVLEYYQGIMILTTNQIAQFDVAVQSRINVAFKYDSLTSKQTVNIFKMFLGQYKKNGMVNVDEYDAIDTWCEKKLPKNGFDGRQIRNVITSAVGLAASNNEKLGVGYLEEVVEIVFDFKTELSKQMDRYKQAQAFSDQRLS
ncbi:hypothetical protein E8E14_011058 [Neopestalotiopsis sp. 37M]|nr:hypothetical protein E8E14_011058 [Neopestalotiopsis sp. 37M]